MQVLLLALPVCVPYRGARVTWRRLFCRHQKRTFVRNIYGDEIYLAAYHRSIWVCDDCGKRLLSKEWGPKDFPELKVGQIVRPRFEDPCVDVLQAIVLAVRDDDVFIQSITGHISRKARRNIVPLDIEGPVYMPWSWEKPQI